MTCTLCRLATVACCVGALAAADSASAAPAAKPYPLNTCIVSGDQLGAMGDTVVIVRQGQEIKLCCKGCVKDVDKDPARYLQKIEAARLAAAASAAAPQR